MEEANKTAEIVRETGSEKQSLEVTRREFLQMTALGTVAALTAACGVEPSEEIPIPTVDLSELVAHPDLYASLPRLSTAGYPEQVGKQVFRIPIPRITVSGKTTTVQFDWVSLEKDTYRLHTRNDSTSPGLLFTVSGGSNYFPYVPLNPAGSNLMFKEQYQITGSISKAKNEKGVEQYLFQPTEVRKVNPGQAPTSK